MLTSVFELAGFAAIAVGVGLIVAVLWGALVGVGAALIVAGGFRVAVSVWNAR